MIIAPGLNSLERNIESYTIPAFIACMLVSDLAPHNVEQPCSPAGTHRLFAFYAARAPMACLEPRGHLSMTSLNSEKL